MSRIKIASIKTAKNQTRYIKTAKRALNISKIFDQQGSYKNSSDFFDLACRYAKFIIAQEEPKEESVEEPRPSADEVDWENVHIQNVGPELAEVYNVDPMGSIDYTKPRPILERNKYGPQSKYEEYHFENANKLTKSFYDALVTYKGNVLQAITSIKDLLISFRVSNINDEPFFGSALGLALAAYFKDNSYLDRYNPVTSSAVFIALRIHLNPVPTRDINKTNTKSIFDTHKRIVSFLKDVFAEELAQNPKEIMSMFSKIIGEFNDFITIDDDDNLHLKISKEDLLAVFFANDHLSQKDLGYIGYNEIINRVNFIKKFGREAYENYINNPDSKITFDSNIHISKLFRFYDTDEENKAPLQRVMNFLINHQNAISQHISYYNTSTSLSIKNFNYVLDQYGEDNVSTFIQYAKIFSFDTVSSVLYSLALRKKTPEEIIEILDKNSSNGINNNIVWEYEKTDQVLEYLDTKPEQSQMFFDYVKRGLIDERIFSSESLSSVRDVLDTCFKQFLDYVVKFSRGDVFLTPILSRDIINIFPYSYKTFGDAILDLNSTKLKNIVKKDSYDRYRFEKEILGLHSTDTEEEKVKQDQISQFIDDHISSWDKENGVAPELTQRMANIVVRMFGNNVDTKHLSANISLPSPIDEENKKIGEDFLKLRTKGIYSLSNLTSKFKYVPTELKSKYDSNEIGILVTYFDLEYNSDNNLNAIRRFENVVQTIAKKYPDIYSGKSDKYYTILKHFYLSPTTKVDDANALFNVLELTRTHAQNELAKEKFEIYDKLSPKNLGIIATLSQARCPDCHENRILKDNQWFCKRCNRYSNKLSSKYDISAAMLENTGLIIAKKINTLIEESQNIDKLIKDINTVTNSNFKKTTDIEQIKSLVKIFVTPDNKESMWPLIQAISSLAHIHQNILSSASDTKKYILLAQNEEQLNSGIEAYLKETYKFVFSDPNEDFEKLDINNLDKNNDLSTNVKFEEITLHDLKEAYNFNNGHKDISTAYLPIDGLGNTPLRRNMYTFSYSEIGEGYRNLDKLILVFGNEIWKWLDKFTTITYFNPNRTKDDPENITKFNQLTEDEQYKIIHDASQVVPENAIDSKNKGIGRYLLQFYRDGISQDIKFIITNWNKKIFIDNSSNSAEYLIAEIAFMEPYKSNPEELVNIIRYQNLIKFFGDNPPKNMNFAYEVSKWYTTGDDDHESDIEITHEDSPDIEELTDEKYRRLEEMYLLSQNIPIPIWARVNPVSVGNYTGKFLPREDTRTIFLGQYTRCCQHPENAAYGAAFDAVLSPKACGFVIEDKNKKIHLQAYVWEDRDGNICFDSFETGSKDFFYSDQRKSQAAEIINKIIAQMGSKKVTGGNGTQSLFPNSQKTQMLQNIGEGRIASYNAFNGVYSIYEGDSSTQYLISDNRSEEAIKAQNSNQYPAVNSSGLIIKLTDGALSNPNMNERNWELDFPKIAKNDQARSEPDLDFNWDED